LLKEKKAFERSGFCHLNDRSQRELENREFSLRNGSGGQMPMELSKTNDQPNYTSSMVTAYHTANPHHDEGNVTAL